MSAVAETGQTTNARLSGRWRWGTVSETGRYINGVAFKPSDWIGEGFPIIRIQNLTDPAKPLNRTRRKVADIYKVEPGDLLVSWSATLDAFIWDREPALLNQHIFKVIPDESVVTRRFLFYLLRLAISDMVKTEHLHGSTMKHINRGPFLAHRVPIPQLDEQQRIVSEIEKQFTRLDAGVASLKRVQTALKRYRASVLKTACKGRLVSTEAELARKENRSYETGEQLLQRTLKERRQHWRGITRHREPASPHLEGLPSLPEGWRWATPDQLSEADSNAICAGPFGTIFKAKDFRPAGVPIIFLRHVLPGRYITQKPGFMAKAKWEELFQPYSVFGGELLVTKLGEPPGVCAIYPESAGPAMVTPDVIKLSAEATAVLPKYLMHYFNSDTARRFATGAAFGTTRLRLTLPIFRKMPVPLPPLAEQERIVAEVERRLSVIDELDSLVTTNLQRAKALRQSTLHAAFSGKLATSNSPER